MILSKVIGFFLERKWLVLFFILAWIGMGVFSFRNLPIDAVPDITNNQVLIITSSPSLGALDIERQITFPIEQATRNVPGIIEQRSFSRFGLSLVTLVFNEETDVYWARQQVGERLALIRSVIPPALGIPELGPVTTGLGEIYQYVIRPKPGYESAYDAMELRTIQDWIVRRQLLGTQGVADVSSFGGKLKQYEVAVNDQQLKAYGCTIQDIFQALEMNNQNTGGAYIEKGPNVLYIRSEGLVKNAEDIGEILVRELNDGTPVRIKNLAEVQLGTAIRYGAVNYNNQGEVAGGVVMMLKGENSSKVIKLVKERMKQIEKTLPEGVVVEAFLDRTKMVNNAIETVRNNLTEGAIIVLIILIIFLGNFRAGLIVASVIPLSMLFAVYMMNVFGVSGNLMSLGALDFGLIVDGAVIIVEAVLHALYIRQREKSDSLKSIDQVVNQSASKMMGAAVFGQLIILVVYLPILSLEGIEGKMFRPMAQTVMFALIGAFILSITYVPVMSALLLKKTKRSKENWSDRLLVYLQNWYRPILIKALHFGMPIVAAVFVFLGSAIYVLVNLGGEFIPKLEEGDFAVDTRVLTGSSLTTTIQATQQTAAILIEKFPEVEKVVTKIGSGEIPTDPMPLEASDMMVILKPKKEWTSANSFDELAEKMSEALVDVPGVTAGFQFPVQMRFNELMSGGRQDIICKIFGENIDSLASFAAKVGSVASSVEGAKDIYVETVTGLPQIVIQYNRAALSQFGLSIETVNKTIQAAFAGAISGQVFEEERRFDLVVRLNQIQRTNLNDVKNLLISTPRGQQIPLEQVAEVDIQIGPNQIQREDAQRRITVGFNVRGRDIASVVKELQEKIQKKMKLPPGYYVTYGGQFENLEAAKDRLMIAVPLALAFIFMLLFFAFGSVAQGLLVYSAIPLSAIGGVWALWLRDMPFSISAGVGFIALFGVAVLNGIVLISEFNHLKKSGMESVQERILYGCISRLRPVLMTAMVASFGFLPMAISNGSGAEVQRPLATVVIGGLLTATILTLFVLPILYQWLEKKSTHIKPLAILLIPLFSILSATDIQAQKKISLQAALDSAMLNNTLIAQSRMQAKSLRALEGTAWELPWMNTSVEYGSYNLFYRDSRIGIEQSFDFPVVYKRNEQLLKSLTTLQEYKTQLDEAQLKQAVKHLFYSLILMTERKKLLIVSDSLYNDWLKRQQTRMKVGEANLLELTTAELQQIQVKNQIQELDADYETLKFEWLRLLQVKLVYDPADVPARRSLELLPDTTSAKFHPLLAMIQQQIEVAQNELSANKVRSSPKISIGYFNQSIIGPQTVQGVDKFFGPTVRFSSAALGVQFPLFNKANKARIESSKLDIESNKLAYETSYLEQQKQMNQIVVQIGKLQRTLGYFENEAIPKSNVLITAMREQVAKGSVSYVEWLLIMQQAIGIQRDYLQAVQQWNEILAALDIFYSTK